MRLIIILMAMLLMNFSVSDQLFESDLDLIEYHLSEISEKDQISSSDIERLNHIDTLMIDMYQRVDGNVDLRYLALKKIVDQKLNRVASDNGAIPFHAYASKKSAKTMLEDQDEKRFLYDSVPCELDISLSEWKRMSLDSRRVQAIRCTMELNKHIIYGVYLDYLEIDPEIRGNIEFHYYIEASGSVDVLSVKSDLPKLFVNDTYKLFKDIRFPVMSSDKFETKYIFSFYPE